MFRKFMVLRFMALARRFRFSERPSTVGDEGIPNRRAQGGCGTGPPGLTGAIILLAARIRRLSLRKGMPEPVCRPTAGQGNSGEPRSIARRVASGLIVTLAGS